MTTASPGVDRVLAAGDPPSDHDHAGEAHADEHGHGHEHDHEHEHDHRVRVRYGRPARWAVRVASLATVVRCGSC